MIERYIDLLREQIMQNTLGNTAKTLTKITDNLLLQHTDHQQEISKAYDFVSCELSGESI